MQIPFHSPGLKRLGFHLFSLRILTFILLMLFDFFTTFSFKELVPPIEDDRIENFHSLPEIERAIMLDHRNHQENSTAISPCLQVRILRFISFLIKDPEMIKLFLLRLGLKSTHSGACFTLADLDYAMSSEQLVVKKEKSSLLSKKAFVDFFIKTQGSGKRKSDEVFNLENLGVEEALKKLVSFSQSISTLVVSCICLHFSHRCF